ncbi:polyamine deacetylase HDAC10 [Ctenopharyngodon idella]|uniref:polyamine deacetylase HDAC10 n=1 Tax=Ctenopharyngodon idella TaxID=7959 RepID=UPI0022303505|nr:polyamine deacetylase HDAC10 [Ctenopharyngodon idella]XP_051739910.1 polyamine deacetylase HDAC10 [Ctenopharyngodon idella]XP_051739911.1 polyamine deacetylase HDAC10 [Ctenopharyngodon idella]
MASGSALIFDEEMIRYKLLWTDPACEIEVPERLTVSYEALKTHGVAQRCTQVPVRQATEQEILLAHSEEYLEAVKQTPKMTVEELKAFSKKYNDVYFHQNIYHCAKLAVGAVLQLVDSVMKREVRNGMALVRPPGHHSQRSAANGFCVFNNVAIAALYAKKNYNLNRVLIVDWDVHHGQGVQYCFEEDPSVLYFSWHRYEHQTFWPNLPESDYTSVGKGKGSGFNINLPWNKVGMTNSDYLAAFFHVLLPAAYEFDPELVLVSAGFDSAIGDPEGEMCASPEIFAHLTQLLMPLAAGKMCVVLEGGYNLTSLSQSVCQTVQTLLGDPAPRLSGLGAACESALESIQNVRKAQSSYWSCFKHIEAHSETSTKRPRLDEKNGGTKEPAEPAPETNKEKKSQDIVWPEPLARTSACVRTVIAPSPGVEVSLPEGCQHLENVSPSTTKEVQSIRDKHFQDVTDQNILQPLGNIISVLDQMMNKEVCNGCIVVSDLSVSIRCAFQHALIGLAERVMVVFIGDGNIPVITNDGKVFLVQICVEETEEKCVNRLSLCLREGESFTAGFMQAVLGLILPLAYEFNPGLVLGVVGESSTKTHLAPVWGHLTSLLQGVAQGRTLTLLQGYNKDLVEVTVAALSGTPVPPLGALGAPKPEDVQVIEKQRQRLQKRWSLVQEGWGLLRCTGTETEVSES